ncbi:hypothetical protein EXIGLDRAFT_697609 [Exidia glandulosa HHB12029]|uniref:Protein kinase domain-containing protein n=1 Tax=Exidia glandulosa HHB12029 TaxID=1314781 RepID=A0A165ENI6_EXIGL|nr:hypothetical protein EXIGLDRAFT_697609 [Exidia glandulosa HHB12029]
MRGRSVPAQQQRESFHILTLAHCKSQRPVAMPHLPLPTNTATLEDSEADPDNDAFKSPTLPTARLALDCSSTMTDTAGDLDASSDNGSESVASTNMPSITTVFFTASEHRSSSPTRSSATNYFVVEDVAVVKVTSLEHFREIFRKFDISDRVRSVSPRPSGYGGSADVKQATVGEDLVALKIPRASNPELRLVQRLASEIAVCSTLSDPNILPFLGLYWDASELPAIVTPWCGNGNIVAYMKEKARQLQPEDLISVQLRLFMG